jgi:uncharacterized protein
MEQKRPPNRLIHESSPYLLQHANNPVDWYPWGKEALEKARNENKPILLSIGYAACHWCHVMEEQSFEHEKIAEVMNRHFVCIKIDREERPDLDQIYMDAVQVMGIRGGWPLHAFLNPEGKPFYGGTYFPPGPWLDLLESISLAFQENRDQLEESAGQFASLLNSSEIRRYGLTEPNATLSKEDFELLFQNFKNRFDAERGGLLPEPKFPMPVNLLFLLRVYSQAGIEEALRHTVLTLREMAWGGIYDQVGGGFARYSVDRDWLVPHFEKMLYDNGQLVSLYSQAFQVTGDVLFKEVVYETIEFVDRELMSREGGFYSSLDADTEGEEGKFYVFTREETENILGKEAPLFWAYYSIEDGEGNWEKGKNILHRRVSDEEFAKSHQLDLKELQKKVRYWKEKIREARSKRTNPNLDDKVLTSWNALMLKGLTDAYRVFKEDRFLEMAIQNADFLFRRMKKGNTLLHNYKDGKASIEGFLEDYSLAIHAFISLYEVTFEERWLNEARRLTDYVLEHFFDKKEGLFYFTSSESEKLIARKKELLDNVIPSSNSIMALNLHQLALFFDHEPYMDLSNNMLYTVKDLVLKEPTHMANWAILYGMKLQPTAEIVITGADVEAFRWQFGLHFLPNTVLMGTSGESSLPLFLNRPNLNGTTIYVCYNKTCQMPVRSVAEALEQLKAT